jgi:hypothetical protein
MPRKHRTITLNGETLTIPQWAKRLNMGAHAIRYRLNTGWSVEEALTTPHTGLGRPVYAERIRIHHRRKSTAELFACEFSRLVRDIDTSLRVFRNRLVAISGQDPGVAENISEEPFDRATPSTQETT